MDEGSSCGVTSTTAHKLFSRRTEALLLDQTPCGRIDIGPALVWERKLLLSSREYSNAYSFTSFQMNPSSMTALGSPWPLLKRILHFFRGASLLPLPQTSTQGSPVLPSRDGQLFQGRARCYCSLVLFRHGPFLLTAEEGCVHSHWCRQTGSNPENIRHWASTFH